MVVEKPPLPISEKGSEVPAGEVRWLIAVFLLFQSPVFQQRVGTRLLTAVSRFQTYGEGCLIVDSVVGDVIFEQREPPLKGVAAQAHILQEFDAVAAVVQADVSL